MNTNFQIIIAVTAILIVIYFIKMYQNSSKIKVNTIPNEKEITTTLNENVEYFNRLDAHEKIEFKNRVQYFLENIKITAVQNAAVNNNDKVLVASAAVIPLFKYKNWFYNNLNEVLIYPSSFNKDFELHGNYRNVVGMVGDGAMHRTMILSLPYLRSGFENNSSSNTAIHEFVHLLDKSDGATDGIPEVIMDTNCIKPWVNLMKEYIQEIKSSEITDINPYGATSDIEFFAVISEYFFQQPEKLKENHPQIYAILEKAFCNPF